MKRALVLHPFIVAVFPAMALYTYNTQELSLSKLVVPFAVALSLASLTPLCTWLVLRNVHKAALKTAEILIARIAGKTKNPRTVSGGFHVHSLVAGVGFEPTTFGLWARRATTAPPRGVVTIPWYFSRRKGQALDH